MEDQGFNLIQFLAGFLTVDNLVNLSPIIVVAGIISAFLNSKSTHPNPWIRAVDQLFRDIANAVALNVFKAKNGDDDRPAA
jgi:hypothetical protein